jgi:hypothetical protein
MNQESFRLGFFTAACLPETGYVGGLLVTNRHGRPLEFQCTLPVRPNRTQELLYGPTLAPFLVGELIGPTLVEKVSAKPHLILTDTPDALELARHASAPVVLLGESATAAPPPDDSSAGGTTLRALRCGKQTVRIDAAHAGIDAVVRGCEQIPRDADLCEPFQRIRDALVEAVRNKP